MAGCIPHVAGNHNATTKAQMEVAAGAIARVVVDTPAALRGGS